MSRFAKEKSIGAATFAAIGALKSARLGFYDQGNHKYSEIILSEPQEIASCTGNISTKEDKIFVHAHSTLANRNGKTTGGHLLEGKVFAGEIHLLELLGKNVVRKYDNVTGLYLWDF